MKPSTLTPHQFKLLDIFELNLIKEKIKVGVGGSSKKLSNRIKQIICTTPKNKPPKPSVKTQCVMLSLPKPVFEKTLHFIRVMVALSLSKTP
jgi:hypothetical protein